jgi:hypothetical protein
MTLTGKDALEYTERLRREHAEERAETLARAKHAAVGKEPFDLAKLETLCDTSSEGRMAPVEARQAKFEDMYYVEYPDIKTLADFARKIDELNKW